MALTHPDLNVYRLDFVPGTSTTNDDNGHRTAVAGIAAGRGFGVVCPS